MFSFSLFREKLDDGMDESSKSLGFFLFAANPFRFSQESVKIEIAEKESVFLGFPAFRLGSGCKAPQN